MIEDVYSLFIVYRLFVFLASKRLNSFSSCFALNLNSCNNQMFTLGVHTRSLGFHAHSLMLHATVESYRTSVKGHRTTVKGCRASINLMQVPIGAAGIAFILFAEAGRDK